MQLAKKTGLPSGWTKYEQHKSISQKLITQAHCNYVSAILNKLLLDHQLKPVFTMGDYTDHLPTMSHPKYPNTENISIEGVEKLLANINIHKASGPDNIRNIILKACSKEISPALAKKFQQCLDTGTLTNDEKYKSYFFKVANTWPITTVSISDQCVLRDIRTHNL